jgi:hypothetical protein
MIFDYMDHDLTGLLERVKRDRDGPGHFTVPQASALPADPSAPALPPPLLLCTRPPVPPPDGLDGAAFCVPCSLQAKCFMRQLFGGLFLLQIKNILHRDLKNANLLVNNEVRAHRGREARQTPEPAPCCHRACTQPQLGPARPPQPSRA